jgi:hypothetical protein
VTQYHKINTLYRRDEKTHKVIPGAWSTPEFEYLAHADWCWTEKLDGTNVRVIYDGQGGRSFAGKTGNAQFHPALLAHLQETIGDSPFGDKPAVLYGEGIGEKIQNGGAYCDGHEFVLFDVMVGGVWLGRYDVNNVARKLGIPVVPVLAVRNPTWAATYVEEGIESFYAKRADRQAEGLVGRPMVELQDKQGRRIIAKIKTKDFAA